MQADVGSKKRNFMPLVFLILFLMLGQDLQETSASVSNNMIFCNGTYADCSLDHDEYGGGEFLSQISSAGGRCLLQNRDSLSYGSLQKQPVCETRKYSDCISKRDGKPTRPCDDYNRCNRHSD